MKPTLLLATLSMVLAAPAAHAKSELETLRSLCQEQERQIRQLENENTRLRSDSGSPRPQPTAATPVLSAATKTETIANPAPVVAATYTVKPGDSLEKIARKTGTSAEKLAKSNGLKATSVIQPGQTLKVPGTAAAPTTAAAAAPSPKTSAKTHKVQPGETYSSISRKYKISTESLIAANPKIKPTALRPGLVIRLNSDTPAAPTAPAPVAQTKPPVVKSPPALPSTPAPAPAPVVAAAKPEEAPAVTTATEQPAPEKAPAAPAPDNRTHTIAVDAEMTYGEFAAKHGTDIERLNALNGLDLTTATILAKGSELYVPAQP